MNVTFGRITEKSTMNRMGSHEDTDFAAEKQLHKANDRVWALQCRLHQAVQYSRLEERSEIKDKQASVSGSEHGGL